MITGSVTNRYAEALFELARAKGVIDDVARDVEFLAAEVSQESVAGFLFDGRIPLEQKSERLQFLQPHVHALTFNFVRLLIDKRRLDVLRHMGAAFRRRILSERFGMKDAGRKAAREAKTLRQVAEVFGVTKERVRQIQNKALEKVRVFLEENARGPVDQLDEDIPLVSEN